MATPAAGFALYGRKAEQQKKSGRAPVVTWHVVPHPVGLVQGAGLRFHCSRISDCPCCCAWNWRCARMAEKLIVYASDVRCAARVGTVQGRAAGSASLVWLVRHP